MRVKPANLSIRDAYDLQGNRTVAGRVIFYHAQLKGIWKRSSGGLYYFEFPSGHILCKSKTSKDFIVVMPKGGTKLSSVIGARFSEIHKTTLCLLRRDCI